MINRVILRTSTSQSRRQFGTSQTVKLSLQDLGNGLNQGQFKNICIMAGAGISVSAGIPDFRSPGVGIYDNLKQYNLPYPEAIFELKYFQKHPQPYYSFCGEVKKSGARDSPTPAHYFVKLLQTKGFLHKMFTQNVDMLEELAGIEDKHMVYAHGTTREAYCSVCRSRDNWKEVRKALDEGVVRYCDRCKHQGKRSPVKPAAVFFGESMPEVFRREATKEALQKVDLVLILGTTLKVKPFGNVPLLVPKQTPMVLINQTQDDVQQGQSFSEEGHNQRLMLKGGCDAMCKAIVQAADWVSDYKGLLPEKHLCNY